MKKEFGKWFLDLAKYILTAIFLTTYLKGIEGNALMWVSIVGFVSTLIAGYFLLRSADMERSKSPISKKETNAGIKQKKQPKRTKK